MTTSGRERPYFESGAEIDGEYRFRLWRTWDVTLPQVLFIMLNPSTADGAEDDPTIRRCVGFAKSWGYGGLEVVNLFALRATDPAELRRHPDPIGPGNDTAINRAALTTSQVVCAWGAHGHLFGRGAIVSRMVLSEHLLWNLGLTKHGHPKHPLYLPASLQPSPWAEVRHAA